MYFSFLCDSLQLFLWTLLFSFLNCGLSESADLNVNFQDEPSLEEWKKDLHLNDELLSKLYTAVNEFLIRKDSNHFKNSDDTFQVNVPNGSTSNLENISPEEPFKDGKASLKRKRSVCNGFRDSLSCFRTYLALWMLQRQGLKDPISLRNIGKRAYSFRSVGKRGRTNYFRSIGKRASFDNLEPAYEQDTDQNDLQEFDKRDVRFPRSYFRSIGKRSDVFDRDSRMAFRNIGKRFSFTSVGKRDDLFDRDSRMSFRSVGKRDDLFDRDSRMSFRSVGKRDPYYNRDQRMAFRSIGKRKSTFDRDSRLAFRSVGKRDDQFERDNRMAFRSIGKRTPGYERENRMAFRTIGKRDPLFDRESRMAFRTIGKRDQSFERNERMSFRNIGKRDASNDLQKRPLRASSFRSIGKRSVGTENDLATFM